MILQVKQRGSWSNVAEFDPQFLARVQEATIPLADVIDDHALALGAGRPCWRVVAQRARAPKVLAYLEGPGFVWRKP